MADRLLRILSSQLKYMPFIARERLCDYEIASATFLRNEPFSFQVLYRAPDGKARLPVSLRIDTSSLSAKAYRVDYVPVSNTTASENSPSGYADTRPGLYPDALMPRPLQPVVCQKGQILCEQDTQTLLNASDTDYRAQWVTVNVSEDAPRGVYPIEIKLISLETGAILETASITLEAIDAMLPPQQARYTNWFHVDCMCDFYRVEPYSDRFYALFRPLMQNAAAHRMDTLLLPAFTPALDTPIGNARRNVQLVDIEAIGGQWRFDFARMARFMREASDSGIAFFEHCHLFSQWGAEHAPNIYDKDGNLLFGWETDAAGGAYRAFLRAYLTALTQFLKDEGYTPDQLLIHISDEPSETQLDSYRRAYESIADLIEPFDRIDALADVAFYRTGLIRTPVAHIGSADAFAAECPRFWLYYTSGPQEGLVTSRMITHTPARTRVLGLAMYHYNAKGFLHWGYNFCYDRMSEGIFDPMHDPCGYKLMPGSCYLVYPTRDGYVPSLREETMREAMDDLRALRLLEQRLGREEVVRLNEAYFGRSVRADLLPEGNMLFAWRQYINDLLRRASFDEKGEQGSPGLRVPAR